MWKTITVQQMGQALQAFEAADWACFVRALDEREDEMFQRTGGTEQASTAPKCALTYLFTFAAAICEKERRDAASFQNMTLGEIGNDYHLQDIIQYPILGGAPRDWRFYLKEIVTWTDEFSRLVRGADDETKAQIEHEQIAPHILNHIKGYLADNPNRENMCPGSTLDGLLSKVGALNDHDRRINRREKKLDASIGALREFLEEQDEFFKKVSQSFQAEPAPADAEQPTIAEPEPEPENPDPIVKKICDLMNNGVRQIVLTGAPGTGKTYIACEAAKAMGSALGAGGANAKYELVLFHPSYDYTDFIEGLRPVQTAAREQTGGYTFVRLDGTFKAFCRKVAAANSEEQQAWRANADEPEFHPKKKYFFIIDEINRADLSKVFGELMFCLEGDKRGRAVQTQYSNLVTYECRDTDGEAPHAVPLAYDVFKKGFYIPENVCIIGTMNDIDRSVESMDFALRRRFTWLEMNVDENSLEMAFQAGKFSDILRGNAKDAAGQIMALNGVIRRQGQKFGLNRQYYIAQGQFANLSEPVPEPEDGQYGRYRGKWGGREDLCKILCFVWKYRLESLLREYVRGEEDNKAEAFLQACMDAFLTPPDRDETAAESLQ